MRKPLRTIVNTAVVGILAANVAYSGGFSLYGEGNGAAIGTYAAGMAALAEDASVGWWNPAGLVLIHEQQAVLAGVGVFPVAKLTGTSSFTTLNPVPITYQESFVDLTSTENALVPSFHFALPLNSRTTFGFSVTSPFGLATDWTPNSGVRYAATYSELITTNISPELGVLLTDHLSFGAGLDLQYARVKFNSMLGVPTVTNLLYNNPALLDSLSYNKGKSYGVGFHAGVLGMFNDNHTRIGLNYQSQMNHTFYGFSRLTGPMANPSNIFVPGSIANGASFNNNLFSNNISFPDIVTLSFYQDVTEKFTFLASAVFTHWNVFENIVLNNVSASTVDAAGNITPVVVNTVVPENYVNAWRLVIGGNYHVNEKLMLRFGGGYDQTPTNNVDRDVRLPDADRWALAIGGRYYPRHNLSVDVGYQHIFGITNQGVNFFEPLGTTAFVNVNAATENSADLVGIQVNWAMDKPLPAPMKK